MIKIEKQYKAEYGDVPERQLERVSSLIRPASKSPKFKFIFDEIKRIKAIEWGNFDCVIYLLPKGSVRPRRRRDNETFYVQGAADNYKLFKKWASKQSHEIVCTPVIFGCDIYLPIPKSMSPVERLLSEMGMILPITKPDFDNLAKSYSDILSGNIIYDDDQIVKSVIRKFYSIKPRIEIHIKYMKDHDSIYNRRKIESRIEKYKMKG